AIVASACSIVPLLSIKKNPVIKNKIPAITNAGPLTNSIDLICSMTFTFDSDAVITVVSDNGESLSPTYQPEITAPATSATGKPKLIPIPIIAIPAVPPEPNDSPIGREVVGQ